MKWQTDQLPVGLIAQLVECCTGIEEANPVQARISRIILTTPLVALHNGGDFSCLIVLQ